MGPCEMKYGNEDKCPFQTNAKLWYMGNEKGVCSGCIEVALAIE